ncbi:DNA repair exonuclease rad1 [Saccharata proteae CBS 121410]|uniref:DNA repair exonuclease rad1 n=1 Tax=Saccharata proteae CBS 121410 TaxID=1314787 RepID=A0A9P4I124_9PEZI|nr:DNA repair exonuclease rad1 [Saccharata proteae CBS 121410]
MAEAPSDRPLFSAVSSSSRQLFFLLRCINFAPKARVQIREDGLRFSIDDSRVMEGFVFLDKNLFTSYQYHSRHQSPFSAVNDDGTPDVPTFAISLPALLETLQIFGLSDTSQRGNPYSSFNGTTRGPTNAFDNRILGMTSVCRLTYAGEGSPLNIVLEEAGVTTTCELTTYEPEYEAEDAIPFSREDLAMKIIMRSSFLYDAITELGSVSPEELTLRASRTAPLFALGANGPLGSTVVDFGSPEDNGRGTDSTAVENVPVLETFQVAHRISQRYRFSLIKAAARAMSAATKVSIRGDEQGVLSLQFMIEVEGGKISFVDFMFVPLVSEETEDEQSAEDAEETDESD